MYWVLGIWLCAGAECGPASPADFGLAERYPSLAACRHVRAALRREHDDIKVGCHKTREESDRLPDGGPAGLPAARVPPTGG